MSVAGNHGDNLPPPPPPTYDVAVNDASQWSTAETFSKKDATDALRAHIKKLCCWGEGPLDEMKIKKLESTTAYKVRINFANQIFRNLCNFLMSYNFNINRLK